MSKHGLLQRHRLSPDTPPPRVAARAGGEGATLPGGTRRPSPGVPGAVATVAVSLAAVAYIAVLAVRLPAFLAQAVPNSDTVSAPLLAAAIGTPGHGAVFLGNHPGYIDLLLSALALHLPDQAVSSQAVTWAVYAAGCLLLAATLRRLAGWTAAGMAALLSLAAAPALLASEASPAGRVPSLANLVLLGWLATVLFGGRRRAALGGRRRGTSAIAALALAVGLVTGLDTVSDPLLAVVGVIPFLGTGLVLGLRCRDRNAATLAFGTAVAAVAGVASALLTIAVAGALSLRALPNPVHLASLRAALHTLHILGGDTGIALGGIFSTLGSGTMTYLETGVALLVCAAVVATVVHAGRSVAGPRPETGRDRAELAHLVFWALVAATDLTVFLATSYAVDLTAYRFLTPLLVASAALLPLLGRHRPAGRAVIAVGVAALAAANAWALASIGLPAPVQSTPLVRALEASGVRNVYADYWEANVTTWATGGRLDVRPVTECGMAGTQLCPVLVNAAAGWFLNPPGLTAVVVDPSRSVKRAPSATYGEPQRVIRIGNVTIYVYSHALRLTASG